MSLYRSPEWFALDFQCFTHDLSIGAKDHRGVVNLAHGRNFVGDH